MVYLFGTWGCETCHHSAPDPSGNGRSVNKRQRTDQRIKHVDTMCVRGYMEKGAESLLIVKYKWKYRWSVRQWLRSVIVGSGLLSELGKNCSTHSGRCLQPFSSEVLQKYGFSVNTLMCLWNSPSSLVNKHAYTHTPPPVERDDDGGKFCTSNREKSCGELHPLKARDLASRARRRFGAMRVWDEDCGGLVMGLTRGLWRRGTGSQVGSANDEAVDKL